MGGSSPRARGTQLPIERVCPATRFIPACAGNTHCYYHYRIRTAVHPRVRGEHQGVSVTEGADTGSSPRARGTPRGSRSCGSKLRFIPACAGNTSTGRRAHRPAAVHPRVRGEHSSNVGRVTVHAGSSPRARGTRRNDRGGLVLRRFIPACAGNTTCTSAMPTGGTVHPRVRGEHGEHRLPPRSRQRFIPACAGNTRRVAR